MNSNKSISSIGLIYKFWIFFSSARKIQTVLLVFLMALVALSEVISLGLVLPFILAISDPKKLNENEIFNLVMSIGFNKAEEPILVITLIFCIAVCITALIRALQLWANTHLAYGIGADFSLDCFRNTLQQSYLDQISRNSSVVKTIITKKIGIVIAVLLQFAILLSSILLSIGVIFTLMLVNMRMTLMTGGVLGGFYLAIMFTSRRILEKNSIKGSELDTNLMQTLQEGLGGVRDIILSNTRNVYVKNFSAIAYNVRDIQATNVFIGGFPKFLMEAIGILFIVASIFYGVNTDTNFSEALPLIGIFALGIQRLLPTFQQIFAAWASVIGNKSAMIEVLELLNKRIPNKLYEYQNTTPIKIKSEIFLKDIKYRYSIGAPYILNSVNLQILKGDRIGLVGRTGGGKSTLADILMGLLKPTVGGILIDGKPILEDDYLAWQKSIAHVPQNIFLTDATIAENIAFGCDVNSINMTEVIGASKKANIDEFIESLSEKYLTKVGEAGIRFSGGQRQRLGLARALYKKSELLVLDEPTSALDGETEDLVMKAIANLDQDLTIIIIAHRVSTLEYCNKIIELNNGNLINYGSYGDYILSKS
jgi:ABC-type multidrug transport system fused ATPase/permease subunit